MSTSEAPVKPDYLNEISDSVAAMVAGMLEEQLAPILETIREHSRLLDLHSALLNHSTIMNRYNIGKLDDLRDLQTNVNYKLQFHIDPEDRKHPTYRGSLPTQHPSNSRSVPDCPTSCHSDTPTGSSSQGSSSLSQDCTDSPSGASSVACAPDPPTRQPTPAFEPPASNPSSPTPPQVSAEDCGAPIKRRPLQRERTHNQTPDPMWNSSRKISLPNPAPAPTPLPPYFPPPSHNDRAAAARCSETSEGTTSQPSPTTQPSESVVGKKRKREDDTSPGGASGSGSVCDEPEQKRKKDTTISTERLPIPESFLRVARLNIFGEPSFEERRYEVEQMRYLKNLFRGGAT